MKDLRILSKEKWQARHWKTITSCYNKSPWFDHYRDDLARLYERNFEFLVDWNLECFRWITDKLAMNITWELSESYRENYKEDEFTDLRNELLPASINQKFPDVKRYPQVFEDRFGFVPNLSILDMLFCVGSLTV
jgi:hypothetical protein